MAQVWFLAERRQQRGAFLEFSKHTDHSLGREGTCLSSTNAVIGAAVARSIDAVS